MNLFDYTQRGIEDQANAYAKMSDKEATRAMLYKAGAGIKQGLMGLMGVEDPDMKKASEIKLMTQGLDLTTAKGLKELAIKLGEKGYNQEGAMAAQRANDLTKAEMEAKVKQATIDKETRLGQKAEFEVQNEKEGIAARYSSLIEAGVPESQAKALASNAKAYSDFMQVNTETVTYNGKKYLLNKKTGEVIKELGTAGKTLEESLGTALGVLEGKRQKEAAGKAGAAEGTETGKATVAIQGKYDALEAVKDAQSMVNKGIYTGMYGPAKKFVAKATEGVIGDKQRVSNTEQFLAYIGETVIPRLQEFGGNDSVEELKYLRQVQAGDIQLEESAIKKILARAQTKIERGIERVKQQQQAVSTGQPLPTSPIPKVDYGKMSDTDLIKQFLPKK